MSKFTWRYSNKQCVSGMVQEEFGEHACIKILMIVAIDPTAKINCISREKDGIFFWSKQRLSCLKESKVPD